MIGFTVGCGLLGLEAFALALGAVAVGGALHRVTVKISERTRISPPAMLLQARSSCEKVVGRIEQRRISMMNLWQMKKGMAFYSVMM